MDDRTDTSGLQRRVYPMPPDVTSALRERGLADAYGRRPAYQQNDYVGWIMRAKRPETRRKRIEQMLDELRRGGVYMNMTWSGGR
jgi:uncharacterized protein YdeI (YjbR/CyaY-like superfamily)